LAHRLPRLESLTKSLGRPLLASHAFADAVDQDMKPLGLHPIRGFSEPEEVYGLPEHDLPAAVQAPEEDRRRLDRNQRKVPMVRSIVPPLRPSAHDCTALRPTVDRVIAPLVDPCLVAGRVMS
jgi:hypothetical protein